MKKILLTILVLGLWGTVVAEIYEVRFNRDGDPVKIPVWADSVKITWDCPCTTLIVDTIYLPSDSLFKMKWDAFDKYVDSILTVRWLMGD